MKSKKPGEVKELIKNYICAYRITDKYDIRRFLRKTYPDIRFKTYDAIDRHLKDFLEDGYIQFDENTDTYSLTDRGRIDMYEQIEKDQILKELNDWDYHLQKKEDDLRISQMVVLDMIEHEKEKHYSKEEWEEHFNQVEKNLAVMKKFLDKELMALLEYYEIY